MANVDFEGLARLVDLAERPRASGWSLRAALTRLGQPCPAEASALTEVVRRIEAALGSEGKRIESEGASLWAALEGRRGGGASADSDSDAGFGDVDPIVGVLDVASDVDAVADRLAAWAVAREGTRPEAEVAEAARAAMARLDALGVAREERVRPPGRRG